MSIEENFKDPQFETSMMPAGFMRFERHCFIFQLIGMMMFGVRSIELIMTNKRGEKEVNSDEKECL